MPMISDADHHALLRDLAATRDGAWVTVTGASMDPTVSRGDRVRVRRCDGIRCGEVVLFESRDGRNVILHRVVARLPGTRYFLHIGDSPSSTIPGIADVASVIGRADLPRRRIGVRTYVAAVRRLLFGAPA